VAERGARAVSHIANGSTVYKNLDCARMAAKEMGGSLDMNRKTFNWYGTYQQNWRSQTSRSVAGFDGRCDAVISFPECNYEVGLVKQPDGSYKTAFDTWGYGKNAGPGTSDPHDGHKLQAKVGKDCYLLTKEYGVAVVRKRLGSQGYQTLRVVDQKTGKVKCVATKG
jgi:hypothetical protein